MAETKLTMQTIARMIDLSAVKAENDELYIRKMVDKAKEFNCVAVFPLPSWIPFIKGLLGPKPDILLGGTVGFPTGGHTTHTKVAETRELIVLGCDEIDVVINIGMMRSGFFDKVYQDVQAVIEAADGMPVKVILECHYLNEKEIRQTCDIAIKAGATWVKTGTGWAPTGATPENIKLIKDHVGDVIKIKAAGGIQDFDTLMQLYDLGARRFGLGLNSGINVLEQASKVLPVEIQ